MAFSTALCRRTPPTASRMLRQRHPFRFVRQTVGIASLARSDRTEDRWPSFSPAGDPRPFSTAAAPGQNRFDILEICARKEAERGPNYYKIDFEAPALAAALKMVKYGVGALVATNEEDADSSFRGIITEVGFMKALILPGGASIKREDASVRDLMVPSHKVVFANAGPFADGDAPPTPEALAGLMAAKRVRHLPVIHDGEVRGVISNRDVTMALSGLREADLARMQSLIYNQEVLGTRTELLERALSLGVAPGIVPGLRDSLGRPVVRSKSGSMQPQTPHRGKPGGRMND